jgi:transposase
MRQRFITPDREQVFLMPPSVRDWLPVGHLAWFVLDAVEAFDLDAFYAGYRADGHGRPAFDPAMMVALAVYAYCVGERSTRRIERRCQEDVAFRVIAGNLVPDHATIARFLVRHEQALAGLFGQVLAMCARSGLARAGTIAVDSTKLAANASGVANMDYERIAREIIREGIATDQAEDELYGQARGDELPPELADPTSRRERLRAAKAELEAEWAAERAEREAMLARRADHEARTGRRAMGRPPKPRDMSGPPPGQLNLTDIDSRPQRTARGFIQGYNAHAVASEDQIVIAAELTNNPSDGGMLAPMINAARAQLTAAGLDLPTNALADSGYWSTREIQQITTTGMTVLIPPDGHAQTGRTEPPARNTHGPLAAQMREELATDPGRQLYRLRQQIIEPIFGDTKFNRRIERFRRRGLAACRAEWQLITATGNLLKLYRASTPAATA